MNKKIFTISSILLGCFSSPAAHAEKFSIFNSFYLGSEFSSFPLHKKNNLNHAASTSKNSENKDFVSLFGFLVGYKYNPYLSMEISYSQTSPFIENCIKNKASTKSTEGHEKYVRDMNKKNQEEIDKLDLEDDEDSIKQQHTEIFPSYTPPIFPSETNKADQKKQIIKNIINSHRKNQENQSVHTEKNISISVKFSYPIMRIINVYNRSGISFSIEKDITSIGTKKSISVNKSICPTIAFGSDIQINENVSSRIEIENKFKKNNKTFSDIQSIHFNFFINFKNFFSKSSTV
jgi:hypothetical protein